MNNLQDELHGLILNSDQPLIFKNILKSELLKWNLDDWERILQDEKLEFRCGRYENTVEPQWERTTKIKKATFKEFLKQSESNSREWQYFDYKYLKNWFTKNEEIRKNIFWAPLGFYNLTADDSTIWIGSKGAHTSCHMDTYGCNLIFQVYGKKQWLIFPPEENLQPTRIPYEESSIYSKLNFFSPSVKQFKGVGNCRKVILNPGEVLFLPHKWWHYVENLEISVSINVWLPSPEDDLERLNESMVQLFVQQISREVSQTTKDKILNPNMENELATLNFSDILEVLNTCKNVCETKCEKTKRLKTEQDPRPVITNCSKSGVEEIISKYEFINKIPVLTPEDFNLLLKNQVSRFECKAGEENAQKYEKETTNVMELLDVLTDSSVISIITQKLLNKHNL